VGGTVGFGAGAEGQKVRLLSLPRFSETGLLVLLDLASLEVHTISFDTSMC
jgi:DNA polymerase delta subunit 2